MKRYPLFLLSLASSSPLLAHPGHGTIPFGGTWYLLTPVALLAIVGLTGYRRYLAKKDNDD